MTDQTDDLPVLNCWHCAFFCMDNRKCPRCEGTGKVFWANGYAYPYTPDGEKRATSALKSAMGPK